MAVMDKTSDWSNRLDPPTIKHLTDNDSPYPCLVMTRSLALIRCVFPAASLNIIFEKSQRPILESVSSLSQLKCRVKPAWNSFLVFWMVVITK